METTITTIGLKTSFKIYQSNLKIWRIFVGRLGIITNGNQ